MHELQTIEAEQAVLGSMLIDSSCIKAVARIVREEDFSVELNGRIFHMMLEMDLRGESIDGITVAAALEKAGIGGEGNRKYLAQLYEITPTAANAAEYAQIVQRTGRRRMLRTTFLDAAEALEDGRSEAEIVPEVEKKIADVTGRSESDLISPTAQLDLFFRHRERIESGSAPYVRTGFRTMDKLLPGGMVNGGLYFLAARPGVGKTALALFISEYVAETFGAVTFISMEMSPEQILARRLSHLSRVDSKVILTEAMTEKEYEAVAKAGGKIGKTPFYITAGKALPVGRITAIARARKDTKLIVVDHFSLISVAGKLAPHVEYAEAAHALKRLALAMNCPVLCLAQLNRENEQRTSKRPRISDLRATGAAEEDADGVILLHRPDYYEDKRPEEEMAGRPMIMEANLAKNRHGETGRVDLSFWPKTNTFRESFIK